MQEIKKKTSLVNVWHANRRMITWRAMAVALMMKSFTPTFVPSSVKTT